MTIAEIKKNAESRMVKSIEAFKSELQKIRTGRAHPGILDQVHVEYYGSHVPLSQVANVSLLDDETKLVTSRLGVERFRVAGTAEFNGFNKDIRADRIRPLIDWVNQCFPGVNTRQVVPWAGLRPMMPSMLPRLGRGRRGNVFYNTGHGHLGWTLSAVTADMVGDVVQDATRGAKALRPSMRPV